MFYYVFSNTLLVKYLTILFGFKKLSFSPIVIVSGLKLYQNVPNCVASELKLINTYKFRLFVWHKHM